MRHEFVYPKKSTLYLHIPACSVLPSADSYLDVIENPMDLGSIQKVLEQGQIRDAQSFVDLTLLVFNNTYSLVFGLGVVLLMLYVILRNVFVRVGRAVLLIVYLPKLVLCFGMSVRHLI